MRLPVPALLGGLALALAAGLATPAAAQPATDAVGAIRARGALVCGTAPSTVGFATPDSAGRFRGLDADYCRAVAAALLGDGEKARIVPTTTQQRFTQLQSGEIDVLSRITTWTLSREGSLGLVFAGVNVFDGQGFLVKTSLAMTEPTVPQSGPSTPTSAQDSSQPPAGGDGWRSR